MLCTVCIAERCHLCFVIHFDESFGGLLTHLTVEFTIEFPFLVICVTSFFYLR